MNGATASAGTVTAADNETEGFGGVRKLEGEIAVEHELHLNRHEEAKIGGKEPGVVAFGERLEGWCQQGLDGATQAVSIAGRNRRRPKAACGRFRSPGWRVLAPAKTLKDSPPLRGMLCDRRLQESMC